MFSRYLTALFVVCVCCFMTNTFCHRHVNAIDSIATENDKIVVYKDEAQNGMTSIVDAIEKMNNNNNLNSYSKHRSLQGDNVAIIGGSFAAEGTYPSYAYFLDCCAGTLISHDLVLTTARCIRLCFNKTVHTGSTNFFTSKVHKIVDYFTHRDFNVTTLANDVGIAKLNCSSPAKILKLNTNSRLPPIGRNVYVAGFGITEEDEPSPDLREAKIRVVSHTDCFTMTNTSRVNRKFMVCARGRTGAAGPSLNDYGTGLMMNTTTNEMIQVGIFSWGFAPLSALPEVYTRVEQYVPYINSMIAIHSAKIKTFCT